MALPGHIESLITRFWLNNGKLKDNFFKKVPLLEHMYKGKKSVSRGYDLVQRIEADEGNFKFYDNLDVLDRTQVEFATSAKWDWTNAMVSLVLAGTDMRRANTREDMVAFVDEHVENALKTGKAKFNEALFLSTGSAGWAKGPEGFAVKFAAGTTACGGVTSTQVPTWAPQRHTGALVITDDATLIAFKKAMIDDVIDNSSPGSKPDAIVTTRTISNKIYQIGLGKVNIVTPITQSQNGQKYADLGFGSVAIEGIPVIVDPDCPAGHAYAFNSDNLKLIVHPDANFTPVGGDDGKKVKLIRLPNQDAWALDLALMTQLVLKERRALAVATNVS